MRFLISLLFVLFSVSAFAQRNAIITQIAPVNLTAAGTEQALSATDVFCRCAVINALAANTGTIVVGDSGVTAANGLVLAKGDSAIMCASDDLVKLNLKNIYIDGTTTNDDVKVSCTTYSTISVVPKPL